MAGNERLGALGSVEPGDALLLQAEPGTEAGETIDPARLNIQDRKTPFQPLDGTALRIIVSSQPEVAHRAITLL